MTMQQNIGDADRVGRMLVGGALAVVFFPLPRNAFSIGVGIVSVDLCLTSLAGWSLLYAVLRFSTRSDKDVKPLNR